MKNNYEIRGDVTVIFLKHSGLLIETLINTIDLPIADSFKGTWHVQLNKSSGNLYVIGNDYSFGKRKTNRLHRLILKANYGEVVDHINHETLKNTRDNLRTITNSQNQQNKKGATRRSETGIRGVFKRNNSWLARVKLNGKAVYEKQFKNINDAEKAVKEARKKLLPYTTN